MTSPEQAFALPTGTVTFLLTDVEGSTRMWSSEPADAMRVATARHYELLAASVANHGGIRPQEQGEGDSIVAAFARQVVHPGLPDEFPPLKAPVAAAHNLPVALTPFIGRLAEIDTLAGLVRRERVVTATGSGGAGKTRLAQQVGAAMLDDFTYGVRWVELAPLGSDDVEGVMRAQFGISSSTQVPFAEAVRRTLDGASCRLILDNCEHVVEAITPLVVALTTACPSLFVLATSRVMLDVPGEVAWRVPPLRLPDHTAAMPIDVLGQL